MGGGSSTPAASAGARGADKHPYLVSFHLHLGLARSPPAAHFPRSSSGGLRRRDARGSVVRWTPHRRSDPGRTRRSSRRCPAPIPRASLDVVGPDSPRPPLDRSRPWTSDRWRLEGRPRAHTPRDRVINDLIKQGIRPGNRDFRRLMKARLERLLKRNSRPQVAKSPASWSYRSSSS